MSYCVHCGISRDYYVSSEHAYRKNCRISNSGYHTFKSWISYFFSQCIDSLKKRKYNIWGKKREIQYIEKEI